MAKKRLRSKYTSKGERRAVAKSNLVNNASVLDVAMNKADAFSKGKKVWFTIPNPNVNETNKRFIRVNGNTYYKTDNYKKFNERHITQ